MKKIIIVFSIVAIVMTLIMLYVPTKKITYKGTVIEHFVVPDKYGHAHYKTIARFEDGYIRELSGFDYYTIPVGGTVHYSEVKLDINYKNK